MLIALTPNKKNSQQSSDLLQKYLTQYNINQTRLLSPNDDDSDLSTTDIQKNTRESLLSDVLPNIFTTAEMFTPQAT